MFNITNHKQMGVNGGETMKNDGERRQTEVNVDKRRRTEVNGDTPNLLNGREGGN